MTPRFAAWRGPTLLAVLLATAAAVSWRIGAPGWTLVVLTAGILVFGGRVLMGLGPLGRWLEARRRLRVAGSGILLAGGVAWAVVAGPAALLLPVAFAVWLLLIGGGILTAALLADIAGFTAARVPRPRQPLGAAGIAAAGLLAVALTLRALLPFLYRDVTWWGDSRWEAVLGYGMLGLFAAAGVAVVLWVGARAGRGRDKLMERITWAGVFLVLAAGVSGHATHAFGAADAATALPPLFLVLAGIKVVRIVVLLPRRVTRGNAWLPPERAPDLMFTFAAAVAFVGAVLTAFGGDDGLRMSVQMVTGFTWLGLGVGIVAVPAWRLGRQARAFMLRRSAAPSSPDRTG